MKTAIIKTGLIFQLIIIIGAGCQKEQENILFWEISPNSETTVIQKEVDSIEFKFCLFNEQGEPAIAFNEGENFSFYFSVTNNRNEKLYFDPGFAYSQENGFLRVYNSGTQDIGKPYVFLGYDKVGPAAYPFDIGKAYTFMQQWIDSRDSTWHWEYGYYKSANQKPLAKGSYYTEFKYQFQFVRNNNEPPLDNNTLRFKINFEIR